MVAVVVSRQPWLAGVRNAACRQTFVVESACRLQAVAGEATILAQTVDVDFLCELDPD